MKSQNLIEKSQKIIARASFVHDSPRKLRLVADAVRGLSPTDAINSLKVLPKRASKTIARVFMQGVANAKNNFQVSPGDLIVDSLQIEEGPRGPKRMDKSHGARFDRGVKRRRMAHVYLRLIIKKK